MRYECCIVDVQIANHTEYFITICPASDEHIALFIEKAADALRQTNFEIISFDVFGLPMKWEALEDAFGQVTWPVTWIENGDAKGIQVWALSGSEVQPLTLDGRIVGSIFENDSGMYCRLGGLTPVNISGPRELQAYQTFEMMEKALNIAGMAFSDLIRTWLFVDDILSWYSDFNRVRDRFFAERKVHDGILPSSTGVGMRSPDGRALMAGALAVKSRNGGMGVCEVQSPLQCAPTEYGSSFSRAVEITTGDFRRLLVSGTASIRADGQTEHPGDVHLQVAHTMEVVEAIMKLRGMEWKDVARAIAYLKDARYAPVFHRVLADRKFPRLPILIVEADLCREDLLFEIELDVLVKMS